MISEKELRAAAREYEKCVLDSLPDVEESEYTFSPKFERRMKKMIFRADHPIRFWIQKSVACFLLAVFLGGGSLLAFSSEARATFFGWVREFYGEYFVYHYEGEDHTVSENTVYRPTWVPDGYEIISESHDIAGGGIDYRYGNEGMIVFDWSVGVESSILRVRPETAEILSTFVNGNPADLYLEDKEGVNSGIVWCDQEKNIIFVIAATLSEEELIKIAESVTAQNFS